MKKVKKLEFQIGKNEMGKGQVLLEHLDEKIYMNRQFFGYNMSWNELPPHLILKLETVISEIEGYFNHTHKEETKDLVKSRFL